MPAAAPHTVLSFPNGSGMLHQDSPQLFRRRTDNEQ